VLADLLDDDDESRDGVGPRERADPIRLLPEARWAPEQIPPS